ncbi:MAG: Uma2 family endonuclease [Leptolyngbyaceae cyanobacterium SM1_3_5]|nr:Uma2 family endonuclease [Leptolyngbyaceae cyanobacterium SM1_3_5]
MTQATQKLTLEEYLAYDDGTDTRYELVDGVLVEMGAESSLNLDIAFFLGLCLAQMGVPRLHIGFKTLIAVDSTKVTAREPDLVVHSEASKRAVAAEKQAFLQHEMPVPLAVIEVVSPGKPGDQNYDRDYIEKPKEYAQRGIPEFWQIDPARSVVSVLTLKGSSYKAKAFRGSDRIQSEQFKQLNLTADQILNAGV